jgi:pimeloyl-ACP methyl ester carboxylesterase
MPLGQHSGNGPTRIDRGRLERHRAYEDEGLGIREEFLQPIIGGAGTVAVLSRPLGPTQSVGWVVCHSFGLEQIHLGRLDVLAARRLSAAGFPVLRYHGQGYGDSQNDRTDIGLSSHLRDATDAAELMLRQEGVRRVGILGAKLGGLVAALAADRLDLDLLGLWEPVVRGSQFARDFLRARLFSEMVGAVRQEEVSDVGELRADLSSQGWVDINGFRLTRDAHDEIARADLGIDLTRFKGRALLVGVSRSAKPSPALSKLRDHLQGLGARCTMEVLTHPLAAQFGQFHFQTVEGGRGKRDMQLELHEEIASTTAAWAAGQADPALAGQEVES